MNANTEDLKKIIYRYQDGYESDHADGSNAWIEQYTQSLNSAVETCGDLHSKIHEAVYSAQYLGFIEGISYALDILTLTGNDSASSQLLRELTNAMTDTDVQL